MYNFYGRTGWPYTNIHELNLDWIMETQKTMEENLTNFVSLNTIKYANPIQWNITSQYPQNMIVIDPGTGTAYISVKPVPTGVELKNAEYWTVVFDLERFYGNFKSGIATDMGADDNTTAALPAGALIWYKNQLYQTITALPAGAKILPGTNANLITIEAWVKSLNEDIVSGLDNIQTLIDKNTGDINTLRDDVEASSAKIAEQGTQINDNKLHNAITAKPLYAIAPQIIGTDVLPVGGDVNVKSQLASVCADSNYVYGFYAYNSTNNKCEVRRYNRAANTIEKGYATFPGGHANSACITPDNRIYVAKLQNYNSDGSATLNGEIAVLNATTLAYINTITLPFTVQGVTYDWAVRKLYVCGIDAGTDNIGIHEWEPVANTTKKVGTITNLSPDKGKGQDLAIYNNIVTMNTYDGLIGWCELAETMNVFENTRQYTPTDGDGYRLLGETSGLEYTPDGRLLQSFYFECDAAIMCTFTYATDSPANLITSGYRSQTARTVRLRCTTDANRWNLGQGTIRSLAETFCFVNPTVRLIQIAESGTDPCTVAIPLVGGLFIRMDSNASYTCPGLTPQGFTHIYVPRGCTWTFTTASGACINCETFGAELVIGSAGNFVNNSSGPLVKLGYRSVANVLEITGTGITIGDAKKALSNYQVWLSDTRVINSITPA